MTARGFFAMLPGIMSSVGIGSVENRSPTDNPYALEKNLTVFLCHGFKHGTLAAVWPELKRWS